MEELRGDHGGYEYSYVFFPNVKILFSKNYCQWQLLFEEERDAFKMKIGDFHVVRRSIDHRVPSKEECQILLIEHKNTAHTGEVQSKITKSIGEQLSRNP